MSNANDKLTIFLSHSHHDYEKVRKIRDILESLDCEPLIFFLKCLDDKNDELEQFIKEEIEARNIFLYCQSHNSKKSEWVQKELSYIKSFDEKRLYTIDIDDNFSNGVIAFLQNISNIIKRNHLFITYSENDYMAIQPIFNYLVMKGFLVDYSGFTGYIGGDAWHEFVADPIKEALREGIYIFVHSSDNQNSKECLAELQYAMHFKDKYNGHILLIILLKENDYETNYQEFDCLGVKKLFIHTPPTEKELEQLVIHLKTID